MAARGNKIPYRFAAFLVLHCFFYAHLDVATASGFDPEVVNDRTSLSFTPHWDPELDDRLISPTADDPNIHRLHRTSSGSSLIGWLHLVVAQTRQRDGSDSPNQHFLADSSDILGASHFNAKHVSEYETTPVENSHVLNTWSLTESRAPMIGSSLSLDGEKSWDRKQKTSTYKGADTRDSDESSLLSRKIDLDLSANSDFRTKLVCCRKQQKRGTGASAAPLTQPIFWNTVWFTPVTDTNRGSLFGYFSHLLRDKDSLRTVKDDAALARTPFSEAIKRPRDDSSVEGDLSKGQATTYSSQSSIVPMENEETTNDYGATGEPPDFQRAISLKWRRRTTAPLPNSEHRCLGCGLARQTRFWDESKNEENIFTRSDAGLNLEVRNDSKNIPLYLLGGAMGR